MIEAGFVDTNILIDALVASDSDHHDRAVQLLSRMSDGEVILHLSATVILEATFVLTRSYQLPRVSVADALANLLSMSGLVAPDKESLIRSLHLWADESPLSFADCYHLVLTRLLGLDAIYTFDKKMNRYPGVQRIEP